MADLGSGAILVPSSLGTGRSLNALARSEYTGGLLKSSQIPKPGRACVVFFGKAGLPTGVLHHLSKCPLVEQLLRSLPMVHRWNSVF